MLLFPASSDTEEALQYNSYSPSKNIKTLVQNYSFPTSSHLMQCVPCLFFVMIFADRNIYIYLVYSKISNAIGPQLRSSCQSEDVWDMFVEEQG